MTTEPVRAAAGWLALREPADAEARAAELVAQIRRGLPTGTRLEVHDLGCGSGSMARWLAPLLPGPQHWVAYDRDAALLPLVVADPPGPARDGTRVTLETRHADITRLEPAALAGASLVSASALLDMMTRPELDRFVTLCTAPGCPVLVALTVTGDVALDPADPLDGVIGEAFDAHQRRPVGADARLGPDAVGEAVAAFASRGRDVVVRPSPWRLGRDHSELMGAWLTGWIDPAVAQRPDLAEPARAYAERRLAQAAAGELTVTVHHADLLIR